MKREVTKEIKVAWLSRMFFGVSHSIDLDISPYDEMEIFLNSKVGSLKWGKDEKLLKEKFSHRYHQLLQYYGIHLAVEQIVYELFNEQQANIKAVENWADHAEFPSDW